MSTQVQLRRGTAEENDQFTGAEGEITVDTTNDTLRIHDGVKKGGYPVMKGNPPITAETHAKITYDEKGLVVSGADLEASDIPDLSESYIPKGNEIEPATATKVTYNKDGLIVKGEGLVDSDIPKLPQEKIIGLEDSLNGKAPSMSVYTPTTTSGSISLKEGALNKVSLSGTCTLVLPTVTDATQIRQLLVQLYKPVGSYNISLGADKFFGGVAPVLSEVGYYNLYYEYDVNAQAWYCGGIFKGN